MIALLMIAAVVMPNSYKLILVVNAPPVVIDYPTKVRWSRLFGQFGGEVKLIPGVDHAASWSVSVAGACPGNGRFSFAP